MNNNIRSGLVCITMFSWPALGFKRGMNSYDYNHSNNRIYKSSTTPLYINKAAWGLCGTVLYLTPPFFFIVAYKEVYRLEVNLRCLEDEKKTAYYNEVLY